MNRPAPLLSALACLVALDAVANPIPVPRPASMPLEEMVFQVDAAGQVRFSGRFTFDSIPSDVTAMLFPLSPVDPRDARVFQDGVELPWTLATELYPTVLPEYPELDMMERSGPFPQAGAIFSVEYDQDVIPRGGDSVLFYSLGTGKYFPTYDKITTALIDVYLPTDARLVDVLLDDSPVPSSDYSFAAGHLDLTLESSFGPFVHDLLVVWNAPAPATTALLGLGLAGMAGWRRQQGSPA